MTHPRATSSPACRATCRAGGSLARPAFYSEDAVRHDPAYLAELYHCIAGYRSCRHAPGMRAYYRRGVQHAINGMRAAAWTAARREGRPSMHRPPSWVGVAA